MFLPGGKALAVRSLFRNSDLARAYGELCTHDVKSLYEGPLGATIVDTAQQPATAPGVSVYGMPVPSSGGTTVGESLNLLESYDNQTRTNLSEVPNTQYPHRFAEATATASADHNRWIGDVQGVPAKELPSQGFADERACQLFDPATAHARPIPFGEPDGSYTSGTPGRACHRPVLGYESFVNEDLANDAVRLQVGHHASFPDGLVRRGPQPLRAGICVRWFTRVPFRTCPIGVESRPGRTLCGGT